MLAVPIIERELRVALRKYKPVRTRTRFAAGCAGAVVLFLVISGLGDNRNVGREVHRLLCIIGFVIVLRAPQLAASAFARERREQTLQLLMLSGISAGE